MGFEVFTIYKNPEKPPCIDLSIPGSSRSLQDTWTIETGSSDFHRRVVKFFKMHFQKNKSKITTYRNYKNLILLIPNPDEEKVLIFTLFCGASKGFMKA